ncbi:MAG: hypothetical protein ABGY96_17195 [bacterium]|nr:hypothetical protein [Gammaproteobacteria bacterium]
MTETELTNHEVTICLKGGAVLGPYRATWSKDKPTDVRELTIEYENFLRGVDQKRFKYHLHDLHSHTAHSVILKFDNVTAIYDQVTLS